MGKPVPVTQFDAFYGGQWIDSFDAKGMRGARAFVNRSYSTPELVVICPDGGDHKAAIAESLRLVPTLRDFASEAEKVTPSDAELEGMSRDELVACYKEMSGGIDPLEDEPEMPLAELLSKCKGYAMIERCGGIDNEEYLRFEAQQIAAGNRA